MYTITIDTKFNRGIVHNRHFMAQIEALGVMSQHAVQIRSLTIIIFVGGRGDKCSEDPTSDGALLFWRKNSNC